MTGFADLSTAYLADVFAEGPTQATSLGWGGYDDLLPDLSAEAHAATAARDDTWSERFAALSEESLTADERIDRDLVLSFLGGRKVMRDWTEWRRNPDAYTGPGAEGVYTLFLNRLRPEPELAASAAARLRSVPDLLAQGRANLDPDLAPPILIRRALAEARGASAYFRDDAPASISDDASRRLVAEAGEPAAAAYDEFCAWLEGFAERAHGDYAIGEARYDGLLREREGLAYGAREMRERGRAASAELVGRGEALAGGADWKAALAEANAEHPSTPEDMRRRYEQWTAAARRFCAERRLVSFNAGEQCRVVAAPPFLRGSLAVASYYQPPPFAGATVGHFLVPFPPEGADEATIAGRLASNQIASIPTTAVHEAYPGHHWQLAWAAARNDRPLRHVLGTPYFFEGWALYAEELLKEQGFFDGDARALWGQLDARLFRAARMVVDTSLHLGEMSTEEATAYMIEHGSLSPETAAAEIARYCAWPTQAPSYLTGALEIERMRAAWLAADRGDLRDFHDTVGALAGLPIGLTERALGLAS